MRELPCSGAILQLLCEERFYFLPDFLLEEMKVRMVCALDGKKRHIAACLLQFVMEQFALSKGHRMVVLPVDDQEGRRILGDKAHRAVFQGFLRMAEAAHCSGLS